MNSITCKIFVVCSAVDAKLLEEDNKGKYRFTIQGGKSLTNIDRGADFADNEGSDHISEKNPNYCELSALYWIWKNVDSDYIGLEHYRRRFNCTDEQLDSLFENGVDAIIPQPMLLPSVEAQYKRFHYAKDWDVMMDILKELYPDFHKTAEKVFQKQVFIPYNMGIYKKEYFHKYCEWLFSILNEVEKRCSSKIDKNQDRYPGFLAERLQTLYILHYLENSTYDYTLLPVKQLKTCDVVLDEMSSQPLTKEFFMNSIFSLHAKNQITKARNFCFENLNKNRLELDEDINNLILFYTIYDEERKLYYKTHFDVPISLEEHLERLNYFRNSLLRISSNNESADVLADFIIKNELSNTYIIMATSTVQTNHVFVLNQLSMSLLTKNEHIKALKIMNEVYKCSQDAYTAFNLAQILYVLGQYNSAANVIDSVDNTDLSVLALKQMIHNALNN